LLPSVYPVPAALIATTVAVPFESFAVTSTVSPDPPPPVVVLLP
jgi:hypothetical protein